MIKIMAGIIVLSMFLVLGAPHVLAAEPTPDSNRREGGRGNRMIVTIFEGSL